MPDTAFTVKVGERSFTLDKITLGDWRMLKVEFGLSASDIVATVSGPNGPVEILNLDDPNVLVGLMVAALRHERPEAAISSLIAEVEALDMNGLSFPDLEQADEDTDPTKAGADEATGDRAKSGNSAKRQKKPGTPR